MNGRDEAADPPSAGLIAGATQANVRRDFAEWHRGRAPYVVWALDLARPTVVRRVAAARRHLAEFLLAGYRRQPHLTLDLCGFPAAGAAAGDEFTAAFLRRQLAALEGAAPRPFRLAIGGLASFASAPYLAVREGGEIAALRACLAVDGGNRLEGHVPHVTVGLYGGNWPAERVNRRLASFTGGEDLGLTIRGLSLMRYDPADIGGPLATLGRFDLRARRWQSAGRRGGPPDWPASAGAPTDKGNTGWPAR